MATKVELLLNLLDEVKEILISIQKERFELNADEAKLKTKKKIADENFQKLIKLKNNDFNAILLIKDEILALDEESDDNRAYKADGIEDKITTMSKCLDQTFAVVDQMKRETEFLENTSTEFEDDSSTDADRSDFFKNQDQDIKSNSYGDSNSEVLIQGRLSCKKCENIYRTIML